MSEEFSEIEGTYAPDGDPMGEIIGGKAMLRRHRPHDRDPNLYTDGVPRDASGVPEPEQALKVDAQGPGGVVEYGPGFGFAMSDEEVRIKALEAVRCAPGTPAEMIIGEAAKLEKYIRGD